MMWRSVAGGAVTEHPMPLTSARVSTRSSVWRVSLKPAAPFYPFQSYPPPYLPPFLHTVPLKAVCHRWEEYVVCFFLVFSSPSFLYIISLLILPSFHSQHESAPGTVCGCSWCFPGDFACSGTIPSFLYLSLPPFSFLF